MTLLNSGFCIVIGALVGTAIDQGHYGMAAGAFTVAVLQAIYAIKD
jgi:hypothetical protein